MPGARRRLERLQKPRQSPEQTLRGRAVQGTGIEGSSASIEVFCAPSPGEVPVPPVMPQRVAKVQGRAVGQAQLCCGEAQSTGINSTRRLAGTFGAVFRRKGKTSP